MDSATQLRFVVSQDKGRFRAEERAGREEEGSYFRSTQRPVIVARAHKAAKGKSWMLGGREEVP